MSELEKETSHEDVMMREELEASVVCMDTSPTPSEGSGNSMHVLSLQ